MAIDRDTLKFLLHLKLSLVEKRVLTIGRMEWYAGGVGIRILNRRMKTNFAQSKYADLPVPENLHSKFDLILDSGSLEHVYNCQQAIFNYMKMCKIGGSLVLVLPTNNQMGHGFYQFSPEFFYRTLSEGHGFKVAEMLMRTGNGFGKWFRLEDPKVFRARQEIRTFSRTMLFIHAIKINETDTFSHAIQSDYEITSSRGTISNWGRRYLASPPAIQFWVRQIIINPRYRVIARMRMKRIHLRY
jgi:hypothetical protein